MTSSELDAYFRSLLKIDDFTAIDDSLNGIQVDNGGRDITKVAFAVDASLEGFKRAAERGAGMLFVHHGLFWGKPVRLRGALLERISFLVKNDIALYAVHLPLDAHPAYGNNAVLAGSLGLRDVAPFGEYHGLRIGFKGILDPPLRFDEAVARVTAAGHKPVALHPFGPEPIRTAAVVSGGAAEDVMQAIDEGLDLYVTGEASHNMYHQCLESRIGMIAAGHYQTEIGGVRSVADKLSADTGLETPFIDLPTGL